MLVVAAVLIAPSCTAACSVPPAAVAGVGVDERGQLVGYLRVCHDHIDGATLYHDEDDDLGSWSASEPVTGSATWSLSDPPPDWEVATPLGDLEEGREYSFYGWTDDDSWSAESVTFTLDDLAALRPHQVLYSSGEVDGERDVDAVSSEASFARDACRLVT